jgi:signal peptidase I
VFDVNYATANPDDTSVPSEDMPQDDIYCPNCGYHITNGPIRDRLGMPQNQYFRDAQGRQFRGPTEFPGGTQPQPVRYGDRILVLKYAFLLSPPRRWDVVVFKAPDAPDKYHYTQNYIKRLVGEPGDTLMVLDGETYLLDEQNNWQVQRRPRDVQEALWRVVNNNDYYPQGLPRSDRAKPWVQPWKTSSGESGWNLGHNASDGRVFHFSGTNEESIRYDALANPATQTTNDYLVYDVPEDQRRIGGENEAGSDSSRNWVSDLKLSALYQRGSGSGSLKMRLSKRDHEFTAEVSADSVTLWHHHPDGTTTADGGPVKLADQGIKPDGPLWLEFMNVNYQVTLRINGKDVLQTTPAEYSPDVDELLKEFHGLASPPTRDGPEISIAAADQTCSLAHVSLWRDIYYTNKNTDARLYWAMPDNPVKLHRRGEPRTDGQGTYDDDEYFVMGDNSLISGDARYWTEPIQLPDEDLDVESGRVPGRFMLGKAFFVYWPAGYRPVAGWPALVPDFGDMRFIH